MSIQGVILLVVIGIAIIGLVIFFVKELLKPGEEVKVVEPQNKKQSSLVVIVLLLLVVVGVCLVGGSYLNSIGGGVITSGNEFEYRVSGSASNAFITYMNDTGGTEQTEVSLPFSKKVNLKSGNPISLVAQNKGDSGSIVCEIFKNGTLWKTATTTAGYGVCTVAGISGIDK